MRHKVICTTKCVIGGDTTYVQDAQIIYRWISNIHERYISVTKGCFYMPHDLHRWSLSDLETL